MTNVMMLSRELKRVPLDFDWPQGETWEGYLLPESLRERDCSACENGYSPAAKALNARWYGYVPFDPAETGSTPLTPETPGARARAERNVASSPDFYGSGEPAIKREARRLAEMWNGQWSHHLEQADVDALLEARRLMDFTHTWSKGTGWQQRDPLPTVTAAEVNAWSIEGFGHDSLNCWIVIKAKCGRLGVSDICAVCEGHGSLEKWPGQRAEAESWESTEPPVGDGYQLWQTISEGGPCSPVFATSAELAEWLSANDSSILAGKSVTEWLAILEGQIFGTDVATDDLVPNEKS